MDRGDILRKVNINLKETIKLVATCRVERLPLVLEILEQEGYTFTEEAIKTAYYDAERERIEDRKKEMEARKIERVSKQQTFMMKRAVEDHREWKETHDEVSLALRDAYMNGVSMTELSRFAGVRRERLYRYMYGLFVPPHGISERIMSALEELSES